MPRPPKLYLAGSWECREEFRDYRQVIEALGFEVTSEWLDEEDAPHSVYTPALAVSHRASAIRDIENIESADFVVCFTEDPLVPRVGGGRHWECGYAYAVGLPVVYVGEKEHIFHHLPSATFLPTLNDLYLWLLAYPDTYEFEERLAAAGTWE